MNHILKTDPEVFQAVWDGIKTFEIRKNDRGFGPGDILTLKETRYTGEEMAKGAFVEYTGRKIVAATLYILNGPMYGLTEGWCIMSIDKMAHFVNEDEKSISP